MSQQMDKEIEKGCGELVALGVVVAILLAWLLVKATELIIRVMAAHPENRAMRIALGAFALTTVSALITGGRYSLLDTAAVAAFGALVLTAKVVEVYYDQLLQVEWSRETVVNSVLHEPWWNV
jgi:hypothetical protein